MALAKKQCLEPAGAGARPAAPAADGGEDAGAAAAASSPSSAACEGDAPEFGARGGTLVAPAAGLIAQGDGESS